MLRFVSDITILIAELAPQYSEHHQVNGKGLEGHDA